MKRALNLPNWMWHNMRIYDLEMYLVLNSLIFGAWAILFQPISSNAPTVRGLYLCNEVMQFLPWSSDWTWGGILAAPSLYHLYWLLKGGGLKARANASIIVAATWSFFDLLLFLANPTTTGIPIYTMLVASNLIVFSQLTKRRYLMDT